MQKRSALRGRAEPRRSVDRDGVVKVELEPRGVNRWLWLVGLLGMAVLVGTALRARKGLDGQLPPRGHRAEGRAQAVVAGATPGSNAQRDSENGVAARPAEAAASTPGDRAEGPGEPGASKGRELVGRGSGREQVERAQVGIGLFPAPGTKQIKRGIIVPDDVTLPPGYVRHYQATDKGRMLQAILMFHPDYKPVDGEGNPISLPADRIVPPEMVPSGIPVEMLEVPEDAYAEVEDSGADTAR